jgi:hypothetical protein
MDPSSLHRRARLRYELGRARFAAPYGIAAAVVVACAWLVAAPTPVGIALGLALTVVCVAFPFASRSLARQVRPGLLAGLVPMVAALGSVEAAGCATACTPWCAPLCTLAGLCVGVWLARSRARWGALLIAALTVAVGCLPLGAGTLVGALVGIAVGSAPFLVNQRG